MKDKQLKESAPINLSWVQSAGQLATGLIFVLVAHAASAQTVAHSSASAHNQAIERIDFLVGEWRGQGWMSMGPNNREEFSSWEKVEKKLGGSALLVQGLHYPMGAEEGAEPVHQALATISWSAANQKYRFSSALADRDGGDFSGFVNDDGAFVWQIENPQRTMRYVIRTDEAGRWVEDGSITFDDGTTWLPFFHMTLEKIGD